MKLIESLGNSYRSGYLSGNSVFGYENQEMCRGTLGPFRQGYEDGLITYKKRVLTKLIQRK